MLYLVSEFADELRVVVVSFDDISLAAGQVRCALDQVGSERALRQIHILRLQVHLANHLVRHLDIKPRYMMQAGTGIQKVNYV